MATFKTAPKVAARPQIKAVKQPIPRQVILPKKAQPVAKAPAKASGIAMPTNVTPRQNVPVSSAEAQRIMNMQKAPSIPMMAQPLPSLPMQQNPNYSQFQNPANLTMGQSSVGTVGYPANGSGTSIYQGQQNPTMANMLAPTMGESSVGSIGYPASMGGGVQQQMSQQDGNPMFNPAYNAPDVNNPLFAGFSAPNPMFNPMYNAPDINNPLFAGFSAPNPMANSMYNAPDVNNPLFAGFSAPMPNNMNQQGFGPMGGNNPQNIRYGGSSPVQQPMGGFGNIGSLLGKG
jgi:hypothetical protein